ncbi:papain-like cysteine protease family protein [Sorangium sp. So ce296]|uniref:papain-like cysteine protease family protein n=1 Tax=Sorangium sp. So ce296 TaxID=3133296 RepID=UPI003F5EB23D
MTTLTLTTTGCLQQPPELDAASGADTETVSETAQPIWTPSWDTIGGPSQSSPAVTSWGSGILSAFWRGPDNHLKHKWFPYYEDWSWEQDLGGSLASAPAAVSWDDGRIDVFWKGSDNRLKHKWYPHLGDWSPEEDIGGNLVSGPAAASWGPGRLDVFWRGTDNHMKHKWYPYYGGWSWEEDLGGNVQSEPAAVSWDDGRVDVFWRGPDNHMKHKWYPHDGAWSWEEDLGGNLMSAPGAASWAPGRLDVFWRGTDNHLKHKWYPYYGGWSWEEDLGGSLTSAPSAVSWGPDRIDVVARGADYSTIEHKVWQDFLHVPFRPQETAQWCWAASGEMIMEYHGAQVSQCDEANRYTGRADCCNTPTPSQCVVPGWPQFSSYGFSSATTAWGTALTLAQVKDQLLTKGLPFAGTRHWTGGSSHMVVVKDYLRFDDDDFLVIHDPWPPNVGDFYIETYDAFVAVSGVHTHGSDVYDIRD